MDYNSDGRITREELKASLIEAMITLKIKFEGPVNKGHEIGSIVKETIIEVEEKQEEGKEEEKKEGQKEHIKDAKEEKTHDQKEEGDKEEGHEEVEDAKDKEPPKEVDKVLFEDELYEKEKADTYINYETFVMSLENFVHEKNGNIVVYDVENGNFVAQEDLIDQSSPDLFAENLK